MPNNCWMKNTIDPSTKKMMCNGIDCDKEFCPKQYIIDKLYSNSMIPSEYMTLSIDISKTDVDIEAFKKLRDISTNIDSFVKEGNNMYLYSSITGNGKTTWASRFIQDYINKVWWKKPSDCLALFINVPRYLLAIKDNITDKSEYVEHIKNNVLNCDLVIWDDIGTKSATSFEHETLLSIIDTRVANSKCNIYTSNLQPQALKACVGNRLYSRIYSESQPNVIELKGADRRGIVNEKRQRRDSK